MACISLAIPYLIYMALQMQIGQVVLMITSLQVVILSYLVRRRFHENQASNVQFLAPLPKLSIKPWQMALLRLFDFSIYQEICRFILLLLLLFGVIISALLIYLQTPSFILVLNTLRLTIILYETEL
jgi:CHASE1-domain containing sensor protein